MGREEKSHSFFFIQPVHEIQESRTGLGVHIGSGFICQHQCRFRNYGPGNGHPLLLAPTQLPWEAILQPLQSHLREYFPHPSSPLSSGDTLEHKDVLSILQSGQHRNEIVTLKNETKTISP